MIIIPSLKFNVSCNRKNVYLFFHTLYTDFESSYYTDSITFGEINSTKSNGPLLENVTVTVECINDQSCHGLYINTVLLVTTLPLVLVCVVLSTTLVSFAVLRCIRAKKRDNHNPTMKSNYYDNRSKVTNEEIEEAYYTTVRSKQDDKLEATMETEEAYYITVRSKHNDKPEATKEIEETDYITMKSICDDKPEVAKETDEVYYTTVGNKHDDRSEATKEIEEAYYNTTMHMKSIYDDIDKPEAATEIEEAYYATVSSIRDDGSREIGKDQGVYYNTIDISTRAVDPQTLDLERNCAYGPSCMHRMAV